jgi:hypothetical protein
MPLFKVKNSDSLSVEELRQWWQTQDEQYDPVEELLRLERELSRFERAHNLSSAEFFRRYESGEMGDELSFVRWAGRYRLYQSLKRSISESLQLVISQSSIAAE